MRNFKFSIIALILGVVFSFGLFGFSQPKAVYAADNQPNSYYLISNGTPYKATEAVGTTKGYGSYPVGSKDVTITTSAEIGFKVVGWNVELTEQGSSVFITKDDLVRRNPVTLEGTLDYDTEESTTFQGEAVTLYSDATDGVNTYEELYKDASGNYFTVSYNTYTFETAETAGGDTEEVDAIIEFGDSNGDGESDTSSFTIDTVFEDMKVEPVFDYIYFLLDVSNFMDKVKLENSLNFGTYVAYYTTQETDGEYLKYTNTIVYDGSKYYFLGDCYLKGLQAFSKQTKLDSGNTVEYVDIEEKEGSFRLGQVVDCYFDFDISADLKTSKNIDVVGASLHVIADNPLTETSDTSVTNRYKVTKDSYLRAKNIVFSIQITSNKSLINTLKLNCHNLYVVDLNKTVDGTNEEVRVKKYANVTLSNGARYDTLYKRDGIYYYVLNNARVPVAVNENIEAFFNEEISVYDSDLLKIKGWTETKEASITVQGYYKQVSEAQYLVKKASDNGGQSFSVVCANYYTEFSSGSVYYYLNFNSIDGDTTGTNKSYPDINANTNITIDYSTAKYDVEFVAAVYKDSQIVEIGSLNTIESKSLKVGEEQVINASSSLEINKGYSFYGFALTQEGSIARTSISIKINAINPTNRVVILCYEHIEYSVIVNNINKASNTITEAGTGTKHNAIHSFNINSNIVNNTGATSVTLGGGFILDDEISISYIVNNGFKVYGLSFDSGLTDMESATFVTSFVIDETFIDSLPGNIINLFIYEEIDAFKLTYNNSILTAEDGSKVLMATIQATAPAHATIVKYDIDNQETTDDTKVAKIEISGLKLYDDVTLTSIGNIITDGGALRYEFDWFTKDNKTTLDYTEASKVYTHIEDILETTTIMVVYSAPNVELKIMINARTERAYQHTETSAFYVTENGVEIPMVSRESNVLTYEIPIEKTIKVTLNASLINFGYELNGYTLQKQGRTTSSLNVDNSFTFESGEGTHVLTINFETIKYKFAVKQNSVQLGMENALYDFGSSQYYTTLNVENTILSFNKPAGFYVSGAYINDRTREYEAMKESNDKTLRNSGDVTYSYNISDFETFIRTYFQNPTETLNVIVDYEIYRYEVVVGHTLNNGTNMLENIKLPTITLKYTYIELDGKPTEVFVTKSYILNNYRSIIFENIPYDSKVELYVADDASMGVSLAGWVSLAGEADDNSYTYLLMNSISRDKSFYYNLDLISYSLQLLYNDNQGAPVVSKGATIFNNTNIKVALFDIITIQSNPIKANGYKFESLTYSSPEVYIHDEATWGEDYANLYVFDGSKYVVNASDQYNELETYYYLTTKTLSNSNDFIIDIIISNFFIQFNDASGKYYFNISLNYKLMQIEINNVSRDYSLSASLHYDSSTAVDDAERAKFEKRLLQISPTDYAEYVVYARNSVSGVERTISASGPNKTVDIMDTITIKININTAATNIKDDKTYDLTYGLELNSTIYVGTNTCGYTFEGLGKYSISFSLKDHIAVVDDVNEILHITFSYRIKTKSLTVTTNVDDPNFYTKHTDTNKGFNISINNQAYGFDLYKEGRYDTPTDMSSINQTYVDSVLQFLGQSEITYNNHFKDYFRIESFKVFLINNALVPEVEYEKYGIYPTYYEASASEKGLKNITVRYVETIKIVLQVQPIIYLEGNEFVKDYLFEREFNCDAAGNGKAVEFTTGTNYLNRVFDIGIPSIIPANMVTVKFTTKQNIVINPINVGEYNVYITFGAVAGYEWLSTIELPFKIELKIYPKELIVDYSRSDIAKIKLPYTGNNNYNLEENNSEVLRHLFFHDNGLVYISYKNIIENNLFSSSLSLNNSTMYAKITRTELNEEKEAINANETELVGYNITIYDMMLNNNAFSKNFKLANTSVTIRDIVYILRRELQLDMTKVQVEDKVYDGLTITKFTPETEFVLSNIVSGHVVELDPTKIKINFEDEKIGDNKDVEIDAQEAITGVNSINYKIQTYVIPDKTIYPYSLSVDVKGLGEIKLFNQRGLEHSSKVDLIPLGAKLKVETIYPDTSGYASIYNSFASYITSTQVFSIGYKLSLDVNGIKQPVSNELFLSVPQVDDATKVLFITEGQSGELEYTTADGYIIIDLSNVENVEALAILEKRTLLKLWQIILIIVSAIVVVAGIVVAFIIIRARKKSKYNVFDRI